MDAIAAYRRLLMGLSLTFSCASITLGTTIIESPPTEFPFLGGGPSSSIEGDTILNVRDGAEIHRSLSASQGGTINLYGGEITQGLGVGNGGYLNIYDGLVDGLSGDLFMGVGSHTTMSGGRFTRPFLKQTTATLVMEGVDFELGGVPVPGLDMPGDEVAVVIPESTLFTGVFANGSPFTFYGEPSGGDEFYGEVTLRRSTRPVGAPVVTVPADPIPPGVLPGQTLIVNDGAQLPAGTNAARGSVVEFRGGVAYQFEGYGADIRVSGGSGSGITAWAGTHVRVTGGEGLRINARRDSHVLVDNGTVSFLTVFAGSDVQISSGTIDYLRVAFQGDVVMRGGEVTHEVRLNEYQSMFHLLGGTILPELWMPQGSKVVIEGGRVGTGEYANINARPQSDLTIIGRHFSLDGSPVGGLVDPGDSVVLPNRNGETLEAVLKDGSSLKLFLGLDLPAEWNQGDPPRSSISDRATLRLVLIPEPTSGLLLITSLLCLVIFSQRLPVSLRR